MNTVSACPCGGADGAKTYADCCSRYHSGPEHLQAPTALALMRSRYSAFVLDELAYLLATWHPSTRPESLGANPPGINWLGLEVRNHATIDADHATVEFIAVSKLGGRAHRLHEVSRFTREGGRWLYQSGEEA